MAKRTKKADTLPEAVDTPTVDGEPLSIRDRMVEIVRSLAVLKQFDVTDAEINSLVDEQFIDVYSRATARYQRQANESFCQAIESDERFVDAMRVAKGQVF